MRAFQKAGIGDPVELALDGKRLVVEAINLVRRDEADPRLLKLRDYLTDELTAAS